MICIETYRIYVIRVRTNRRVRWQYSDYCGRWASAEEAIEKAKERYGATPFEYCIENLATDEVVTGFVNWEQKRRKK